jgi:hypothetical protein
MLKTPAGPCPLAGGADDGADRNCFLQFGSSRGTSLYDGASQSFDELPKVLSRRSRSRVTNRKGCNRPSLDDGRPST